MADLKRAFDDRGVVDGIFERVGQRSFVADGLGEEIGLDGELVANGNGFDDLAASGVEVLAVVNDDARGLVGGRVEGNLDIGVAFGAEKLHLLVINHLGADGEDALAAREFENGGGQAIGLETGIAFNATDDANGLLAKNKAGSADGVAADVHQSAPGKIFHVSNVGGIDIEIAEDADGGTEFANAAGIDDIAGAQPLRVGDDHETFFDLDVVLVTCFANAACFRDIARHGFFAENIFAAAGGANGPLCMEMIGQGIVDDFNFGIVQQVIVGAIDFGDVKVLGNFFSFLDGTRTDGGELRVFALQHGGKNALGGDACGAENSPLYFSTHGSPCLMERSIKLRP